MRREKVTCLPVVQDGRLVGIVSEHDFLGIASHLLQEQDGEESAEG
jgi:CBS domain-containing protein